METSVFDNGNGYIRLSNASGKRTAFIGGWNNFQRGGLALHDKNGKRRVELDGSGDISFNNTSGKQVAYLGKWGNSERGGLTLYDKNGKRRVELDGSGDISFNNTSGKQVAYLGKWNNSEDGGLALFDKNGKRGIELGGTGNVRVNGQKVHDYAELFDLATREGVRPGSVVAYDPDASGLMPASKSNARQVVGVISGAGGLRPGMVIGSRKDGSEDFPLSMSGIIYVRVCDEAGPLRAGDLLVPSSVAGVGMRAVDPVTATGTVFGKALEPYSGAGEGLVLMLVMNR